ncbi:MAG: hypothetical protein ACI86M_001762 [Saprospiraceae bacterium]|jgi:hypothetical protein
MFKMKNQIINTLIAVIFSAISVFATSTEPSITSNGTKSFVIDNKVWKSSSVDILIQDEDGITIYSNQQELKTSKRYSLENLEAGDYVVTVSNRIKTVANNITITEEGLFIDFNANTTYKPVFNIDKNKIDVNYLAAGVDTYIYIQNNDQTLYQTTIEDSKSINKRFDISKLPSGDYSLVISNKTGSFSKRFSK